MKTDIASKPNGRRTSPGGRPRKASTEKRSRQCNLRYTLGEIRQIETSAAGLGVSVSEYIRQRSLAGRVRPAGYQKGSNPTLVVALDTLGRRLQELQEQISREGNVINQLARKSNADISDMELKRALDEWHHLPEMVETTNLKTQATISQLSTSLVTLIAEVAGDDQ